MGFELETRAYPDVNFYPRFCGDYMRDTAHLSLAEHGVYAVLLDTQYSTERGLPPDSAALFRICRAMTDAERASVETVVNQFFPIADDGLRWNPRARSTIADAQRRIVAARENGKRGGRPRKNPVGSEPETQAEPSGKTHHIHIQRTTNTLPQSAFADLGAASGNVVCLKPDPIAGFAVFWKAYPRKVGKKDAAKAWQRIKPDDRLRARIMAALAGAKASDQWTRDAGQFVPYPATWLNGERWDDEGTSTAATADRHWD